MNNTTVCVSTDNDEDEDVDNDDDDDGGKECSFKDFEGKTKEDEHRKVEMSPEADSNADELFDKCGNIEGVITDRCGVSD